MLWMETKRCFEYAQANNNEGFQFFSSYIVQLICDD